MNYRTPELLERTFHFAVNLLKFLNTLPYRQVYRAPILQISRSSTSIGANYEEAQCASSRRDFNYKISISLREARETNYWLRILSSLYEDDSYKTEFDQYKIESNELARIFASIKIAANK